MSVWAVIVAAGSGTRMGLSINKTLAVLGGETVLERSVRAFDGLTDGVVVVYRAEDEETVRALNLPVTLAHGGDTRQASVLNGLRALPEDAEIVLVHDAARPFVTRQIIARCIESVQKYGSGVAAMPVTDTIKRADENGCVQETLPRETLWAMQTPQAFRAAELRAAIETLQARGESATDDARAMEACGHTVRLVEGEAGNIKLTRPEDLVIARARIQKNGGEPMLRMGHGYDAHRLVEDRKLILCGVEIPYEKGLLGHSDADVALHALMDALLGALALGDIGGHFPDSDTKYKGVSSMLLLREVAALLAAQGAAVNNVDVTILAQRPKLKPYIEQMRRNVAGALKIDVSRVSVKATTTEGMGFEGEGLGVSAHAVALVEG